MASVTETVQIGVRVPKHIADELARIAESQDRTFSAEVRRALREYVQRERAEAAA